MNAAETMQRLESTGVVAVIRADSPDQCREICQALARGGVVGWEIAMTTPRALRAIELVADTLGDEGIVGVGTALDGPTASAAIHAGAEFVFSPTVALDVIETAKRYGKMVVPGALTPTEVLAAWTAGGDLVKVFPAGRMGPKYFNDLRGPLPQVKLTPTGGVDLTTAADWINAGACCLGAGSSLVKMSHVRGGEFDEITNLAEQFIDTVREARTNGHEAR